MQYYFIRKRGRSTLNPYDGPACAEAGVPRGAWYLSEQEAQADADRLSAVNPVGFEVVRWSNPDHDFHQYDE